MVQAVEGFTEHERYLFGIAYRMLGSAADAEDIVQEAYLRWRDADREAIESPRAYLATIVTRLSLDHLRSARVQRETYTGPWLPEPIVTDPDPAETIALADSVSMAFLVLLERLSPLERAAFLLREVFDYSYAEVAAMLDRSETACRQLVHRAKERVEAGRPRFDATPAEARALTERFLEATREGDMAGLLELLADDVTVWSDGGGQVVAARNPVYGADKVARFVLGIWRRRRPETEVRLATVNGSPGFVVYVRGRPNTVGSLQFQDGRVAGMRFVLNPDKLQRVPPLPAS